MSEALLEARGLCKSYTMGEERIEVLCGADITIAPAELVAVVGASGTGKSTLLHVLGLLDPSEAGTLTIAGRDMHQLPDSQRSMVRRGLIGFVFQFYHLLAELNVLENIELAGRMRLPEDGRMSKRARRDRAHDLLCRVGLEHRLRHRPAQLSGGEKQRVAIARALFHRPRLLLCDEPTGNLDRGTGMRVWEELLGVRAEEGTAAVMVTHDDDLASACERILRLEDGKLA